MATTQGRDEHRLTYAKYGPVAGADVIARFGGLVPGPLDGDGRSWVDPEGSYYVTIEEATLENG